nr:PAS domain S-box protein [Bacillus sp. FJAT-47783]
MNFATGSSWSEDRAGTNAIGTAIATGMPVQIFAGEHFCQEVQKWTCFAAPVRDPATNKLIGVIDLTGLWTAKHPHFLSVIKKAARNIEKSLYTHLQMERFKLLEHYQSVSGVSHTPMMVIDRGLKVVKASPVMYENGFIDSDKNLTGAPFTNLSPFTKTNWEVNYKNGRWSFELTPYMYGGTQIGSVVHVIPPAMTLIKDMSVSIRRIKEKEVHYSCNKEKNNQLETIMKEEFYQSLFKHNPNGIFSFNLEGRCIDANPAAEKLIGYSIEEICKESIHTLIAKDNFDKDYQYFKRTTRGIPQKFETFTRHKNGHRVDISVESFPIIVNHEIVGVYGIVKDITKDKQIKEELKSMKQQLDLFLNNTVDAISIIDVHLHIIKVNKAFEQVFGWTEQELIGNKCPVIPEYLMEDTENRIEKMKNERQVMSFETIRKTKDNQFLNVSNFISPIVNGSGDVIGFVSIMRDISERIRMEEALKESEKRLRTLINAMPDIVIFKDGKGRWLEANEFTLSCYNFRGVPYKGKTNSELIDYNLLNKETLSMCQETDEKVWESGHMIRGEEHITLENGKKAIFDVIKVPIYKRDGKRNGLVVIGRDITELKNTEDLLRMSEKLAVVGQLSAGIAHEIRNPLTSLKGFMQLLESSSNEEQKWYFDVMLSEIDRIDSIANQFMAIAKPQVKEIRTIDLNKLLEQVMVIVSPEAILSNVELKVETERDIPVIECEENQIKQVFINIIKNSIEAINKGGDILIQVMKNDEAHVLIRFIDNGCGIPKERILHLGEPFYSLKEKGTGLGLMICYKIVEEHKGKMFIDSEVDKGTTVDILLPIKSNLKKL